MAPPTRALVVDPELGARTLVADVLQHFGFEVVLAPDSMEAHRAGFAVFTLLVTAVDLEQRSGGINLAHVLRGFHPDLKIIYLVQQECDVQRCAAAGGNVLKKPFTIAQLRQAVADTREGVGRAVRSA